MHSEKTIHQLVQEFVTPMLVDGESVDHANDYKVLFEQLDWLSGGALALTGFAATNGKRRSITLTRQSKPTITLDLQGDTDWVDHEALVTQLDRAFAAEGQTSRICAYYSPEFGQEIAFAFLPETESKLLASIVADRNDNDEDAMEGFYPAAVERDD